MLKIVESARPVNGSTTKTLKTEAACPGDRKPRKPAKSKPNAQTAAKDHSVIEYDSDLTPVRIVAGGLTLSRATKLAHSRQNAVAIDNKTIEHFQEGRGYDGMPAADAKHLRWRLYGASQVAALEEGPREFTKDERAELIARMQRMLGLVRSGRISTTREVGMMARALDRFCGQTEGMNRNDLGQLRSPNFDEGFCGDEEDQELQAELEAPLTEPAPASGTTDFRIVIVHDDGNVYIEPGIYDADGANEFIADFDKSEGVAWIAEEREDEAKPAKTRIAKAFDRWLTRLIEARNVGIIENTLAVARVAASLRQLARDNCDPSETELDGQCHNDEGVLDDEQFELQWAILECEYKWPVLDSILSAEAAKNNGIRKMRRTHAQGVKRHRRLMQSLAPLEFNGLNCMTGYFLYQLNECNQVRQGDTLYATRKEARAVARQCTKTFGRGKVRVGRLFICPMFEAIHANRSCFRMRGMQFADNMAWNEYKQTDAYHRMRLGLTPGRASR